MSVSDPLLKDLKGCILNLVKSDNEVIGDSHPTLEFLCTTLEAIFRKGLSCTQPSPFGITRKDYWSWIEYILNSTSLFDTAFKLSLSKLLDSHRTTTLQGKGRLFFRHALFSRCLYVPVEAMVRKKSLIKMYNEDDSILGNEILGEIFLSLAFQLSQIRFELQLENSAFLDHTWNLPHFRKYELCPCLDLGIYLGHVKGWAVVLRVDEGSVAAEDKKIEAGDVIDEVFGVCIRGWRKGKIAALFKENKGLPISLNVIKGRSKDGQIYPSLVPILRRLQLDMDCNGPQGSTVSSISDSEDSPSSPPYRISGHHVTFVGSVDVGGLGDVSLIDGAVTAVLASKQIPIDVAMVTGEIGVQTVVRATRKLLLSHSYTEISSCGRRNDNPLLYAYIAGNTSCNLSSQFMCYVFQASTEQLSKEILLTLADGFHRTHWAV